MEESPQPKAPDLPRTRTGAEVSAYRWAIAGAMAVSNWSNTVTTFSLGLLLPAITESMGLSVLQKGWLGSSIQLGNLVVALPAALFLSRFNPLKLSTVAALFGALFAFLHGLAPSYAVLLLARLGFGLTFSARQPARAMLLQWWFPLREVPLVNGILGGFSGGAASFALAVTPFILALTGSWRHTYFIFGLFTTAVFLFWLLLTRRSAAAYRERGGPEPGLPYRAVFRYPRLWLAGLAASGGTFVWAAFATFWPTYMLETHDFPLTRAGFLLGLVTLAQIPSQMLMGYLASRISKRRVILATCGVLLAVSFVGMTMTAQTWALVLLGLLGGLGFAYSPVAGSIPFEVPGIKPREVAVGSTMMTIQGTIGGMLGPVTVGAIAEATGSLSLGLLVAGLMPLSLVVFSIPLQDRPRA